MPVRPGVHVLTVHLRSCVRVHRGARADAVANGRAHAPQRPHAGARALRQLRPWASRERGGRGGRRPARHDARRGSRLVTRRSQARTRLVPSHPSQRDRRPPPHARRRSGARAVVCRPRGSRGRPGRRARPHAMRVRDAAPRRASPFVRRGPPPRRSRGRGPECGRRCDRHLAEQPSRANPPHAALSKNASASTAASRRFVHASTVRATRSAVAATTEVLLVQKNGREACRSRAAAVAHPPSPIRNIASMPASLMHSGGM
jgi:hypothetical protein